MDQDKVKEYAVAQGYESFVYYGEWDGYQVYEPVYPSGEGEDYACVGIPLVILVKEGEIRMSDIDETFRFYDMVNEDEDDDPERIDI